ncbi:MAG: flagellar motor switch protein FliN [Pseudomonadota bacterium]
MTEETEHATEAAQPQATAHGAEGEILEQADSVIPDLGVLSRVKVTLTVDVGQTQITLRDLIRLNEGSVLELDRLAGDPLEVLANGVPIAKGEVVVVGEKFGVRLGEIVEARRRVKNL